MKAPTAPRALVGNMADEDQVHKAADKEAMGLESSAEAWLAVLDSYPGRRVLVEVLEHCQPFGSVVPVTSPIDPLQLAKNAGRQDVGHFLMVKIQETRADALYQMMAEKTQREMDHAS